MKYRGIVFDKDGTLLDFNKTWLPVYLHAALEFAEGDDRLAGQLLEATRFRPGAIPLYRRQPAGGR